MKYMNVHEAAEKWKISDRLVQKYCAESRIIGAQKQNRCWIIPETANKPQDPRKRQKSAIKKSSYPPPTLSTNFDPDLMPLMNSAFEPGKCMNYINAIGDTLQKQIALAEYYYFSGQPELAAEKAELFFNNPRKGLSLSACLIYAFANLSIGNISQSRHALSKIKQALISNTNSFSQSKAAESFIYMTSSVLLHLPLPKEIPPVQDFLPLLPPGLRSFAMYVIAHYAYLEEDYQKSIGIVEATLAMQAQKYPISNIYLHLIAVMDHMSLRQSKQAREHLLIAWNIARPDNLLEGFGEHHGLLGGMLEAVIKKQWPEDFKRIINITYRFSAGWRKIHNPDTGHSVADNLTTTEFATAMLAARGWTNLEISKHMNISPNTVKQYISTALQKLNISHRRDLKKYMLQ